MSTTSYTPVQQPDVEAGFQNVKVAGSLHKLLTKNEHNFKEHAHRIMCIPGLTALETEVLAKRKIKISQLRKEAQNMIHLDSYLFQIATIFGIIVPVLTGITGLNADNTDVVDCTAGATVFQPFPASVIKALWITSVVLSLFATILHSIVKTQNWGQRGGEILAAANEMRRLYDNFTTLSGPLFSKDSEYKHSGQNFRLFNTEYTKLDEKLRKGRFAGMGSNSDDDDN